MESPNPYVPDRFPFVAPSRASVARARRTMSHRSLRSICALVASTVVVARANSRERFHALARAPACAAVAACARAQSALHARDDVDATTLDVTVDVSPRATARAHAESARDVHRITEPPRSEEWMASHAHARPRVDDGERANGRVRSRARRGDGERETRERRGERRAGWCTCTISRCKNREA